VHPTEGSNQWVREALHVERQRNEFRETMVLSPK
jgi:hypothetical protein